MTELRYLPDADGVTEFEATVTGATDDYLVLDGTHFYPGGGGQPPDRGTLSWDGGRAAVVDAEKNHGDVRHYLGDVEGDPPAPGATVTGRIDADRRDRLRRMHTAQHVVSRVVLDDYGAATVGNRISVDGARVDVEPAAFDDADLAAIERRTNAVLDRDLPVEKSERLRGAVEDAVPEGRAQLDLIPGDVDPLRVVEIGDFDLCPCGGTHVDRLGEVGTVRITDRAAKGTDVERIEYDLTP
ncbi:alanyl-tRNA editing protein [Haloplanus halophilus]|uniref:alanyl-tRNA editing protein n=1 Tax=Haloplanus halophilus TaxID=2949993 RepID=UPI00203C449B|nr:alanyl-tRNA editing protein [Haloplanus sp. GDY1]